MTSKDKRLIIELSPAQAIAAFAACSNYTPLRGEPYAQRSQSLAAAALNIVIRKAGMSKRVKRVKR